MLRNVKVIDGCGDFGVPKKSIRTFRTYTGKYSASPLLPLEQIKSSQRKLSRKLKNEKEEQGKPSQRKNGQIWYLPAAVTGRYKDLKAAFGML